MRPTLATPLMLLGVPLLLASLAACDKPKGLYADRAAPAAPAAPAGGTPRFVGRWAVSAGQCQDPWVIEARSLKTAGWDCDFDRVDSNSAGYTVPAVCSSAKGPTPVRLSFVTPNQAQISQLTVSGGPFKDAVPLQRCEAAAG